MKPEKKFIPGVCKAILSGDTVIIRGHPDQGSNKDFPLISYLFTSVAALYKY
jgi:hypothetical protein